MAVSLDRKELEIGTAFLSVLSLGLVLVPLTSSGEFTERLLAVLDDNVLGFAPLAYVVVVAVIAWLPLPYWLWNLLIVQEYSKEHRKRARVTGTSDLSALAAFGVYLRFLATPRDPEPTLRRAKRVAFAGFVYLIAVVMAWIAWTSHAGI